MSEDIPLPPEHEGVNHYYGDSVRLMFIVTAAIVFAAQFFGSPFLTIGATLVICVVLICAAGLTNPVQTWIHVVNVIVAGGLLLLFGMIALARYRETGIALGSGFIAILLVLLMVYALYNAIRTLRGILMRGMPDLTKE